jgi:riboflavin synthase
VFTGLVAEKGALVRRTPSAAGARLEIAVPPGKAMAELVLGESISVSGCCLTVAAKTERGFEADASPETLALTTLGGLPEGAAVNLERALQVGDRLGGHLVSGHVDGVGEVVARKLAPSGEGAGEGAGASGGWAGDGDSLVLRFRVPQELARFLAVKGSIVVDGVSLTVNVVEKNELAVMLIPVTRAKTSLDALEVGSKVNIEVDTIARYVAQLLDARGITG